MAYLSIKHVSIKGVSAAVPANSEEVKSVESISEEDAQKFTASTGISSRRISTPAICTSDLCQSAAEVLISELGWRKEDIDCLIFVTQTPDYILPATAVVLQHKLGLSTSCLALDISLGCSGWVYGLSVMSSLASKGIKKGLLLAGDTVTKFCSKMDKSTYPLFGDAGTATAVEFDTTSEGNLYFSLSSDGEGKDAIIIPDGGYRNQVSMDSFKDEVVADQIVRNRLQLILDGMNVFSFGISRVPESVNQLMQEFGINKEEVNDFYFHQANLFMNEKIRKKLKLEPEKVPYSLKEFGNTSAATIPLTMVTQRRTELTSMHRKNIACGFGVGLSWGSVYFETNKIVCPDLIEI